MQLTINQNKIKQLCTQEGISFLGLFGSYARGDAKRSSDVDVLIDFNHPKSYFQLARVQDKFEGIFKKKVDLVLRSTLKDQLKPNIFKDLIPLYGKK